jgi:transcriptional regulator with XRE-family HTH domain
MKRFLVRHNGAMLQGELGEFLRSRREAVTPAAVGLPTGVRRRTPGLRRAELATLAGISVDYLIRLEQGRDRRPSPQVLAALADALRLSEDDREHLRRLSIVAQGTELCPAALPPARIVRPTVTTLLEQLEPAPAFVINRLTELLAWTTGYDRVARPLGILDGEQPNLIRYTFADDRSRAAYVDWTDVAREQVANLRAFARPDDGTGQSLIAELKASNQAFTALWDEALVASKRTGVNRIVHPEVGELRLAFETLDLPDADGQRLVVYLAADDQTSQGLDILNGRQPGALRAVKAG